MKYAKFLLILTVAFGVVSSCSPMKESPEPSTSDSGGSGGGGGNTGDPDVYIGLWKLTDKTVSGSSVFGNLDTIPEVSLQPAGTATWNYYVGGNIADTESDIYSLNTSGTPPTITFTNKGLREIVNKTGSLIEWKFNDPSLSGLEVVETYTKQ